MAETKNGFYKYPLIDGDKGLKHAVLSCWNDILLGEDIEDAIEQHSWFTMSKDEENEIRQHLKIRLKIDKEEFIDDATKTFLSQYIQKGEDNSDVVTKARELAIEMWNIKEKEKEAERAQRHIERQKEKESKPKEKPVIKKPQSIADIANAY